MAFYSKCVVGFAGTMDRTTINTLCSVISAYNLTRSRRSKEAHFVPSGHYDVFGFEVEVLDEESVNGLVAPHHELFLRTYAVEDLAAVSDIHIRKERGN